jgi:hypothetical protein
MAGELVREFVNKNPYWPSGRGVSRGQGPSTSFIWQDLQAMP